MACSIMVWARVVLGVPWEPRGSGWSPCHGWSPCPDGHHVMGGHHPGYAGISNPCVLMIFQIEMAHEYMFDIPFAHLPESLWQRSGPWERSTAPGCRLLTQGSVDCTQGPLLGTAPVPKTFWEVRSRGPAVPRSLVLVEKQYKPDTGGEAKSRPLYDVKP